MFLPFFLRLALSLGIAGAMRPLCGQEWDPDAPLRSDQWSARISSPRRGLASEDVASWMTWWAERTRERSLAPSALLLSPLNALELRSQDGKEKYLGRVNENPFDPESKSNPYGR